MVDEGLSLAVEVTGGCPKCGSQAYQPGTPCLLCGFAGRRLTEPAEEDAWARRAGQRALQSERRLHRAFAAMDRELYGEAPMADQEKVYRCRECQETFPTCQALAGHVNHHRHEDRLKAKAAERELRPPAGRKSPHRAPPANGGGLRCPLCVQPLSPEVQVLVDQFTVEGVDEELVVKLAAKAYGLLRVS